MDNMTMMMRAWNDCFREPVARKSDDIRELRGDINAGRVDFAQLEMSDR